MITATFFGSSVLPVPTQGVELGLRVCSTTREYKGCLCHKIAGKFWVVNFI